jgi:SAM-dependent methyltransferase
MASQAAVLALPQRELVSCRVCSGSPSTPYLSARGYTVVRCHTCGLLYVNPQPSVKELERIYSAFDQGDQWREGEEAFNRGVRKVVLRFKRGGAAMDVGSGSGNFLRCLRESGFRVFGVEPSETGSTYAQSVHGIETFNGTVEAFLASGANRDFDVVTILNVLEHLKDPASTLLELRQLLRSGGIVVIVVPDARLHALLGQVRRRLGFKDPFWMETERHPLVGFDPPQHLCSFEPRTLSQLVKRCGFEPVYLANAPVIFNDDRWKNMAKTVLRTISQAIYWLTFRRLILGYSTLLVALKP